MSDLSSKLQEKMAVDGLLVTAAAQRAGVPFRTFKGLVSGTSVPNERTYARIAKFLGLKTDEVRQLAGELKFRVAGQRKSHSAQRLVIAPTSRKAAELAEAMREASVLVGKAQGLLDDPLINRVHELDGEQRRMVEAFVDSITLFKKTKPAARAAT